MESVLALTILLCVFAAGDYVANKTKGTISMVLFVSLVLLIGFWTGLPKTIIEDSKVLALSMVAASLLVTSLGTLIDLEELIRQWKTVVIGLMVVLVIALLLYFFGGALIGKQMAIVGAPVVMGGSAAAIILTSTLKAKGMTELAVWCVLILVMHKFVGVPIASVLLKKEANRVLRLHRSQQFHTPAETGRRINRRRNLRIFPETPKDLQTPFILLAKLGLVVVLCNQVSALTHGAVNVFILYLVLGVVFTETGFLEKDILKKANSNGIIMFIALIIVFANLTQATPLMLLSFIKPLVVILLIAVAGILLVGMAMSRLLNLTPELAIAVGVSCFFGFPGTYYISQEISEAVGETAEERKLLLDYILPKMLVAGFVTVTIASVIIAGFMVNLL